MTQAQPPAGWYPDPQDATQQRYWDGSVWTGHTAAAGATAAPQGDATAGAPIPAAGAPAWSTQPGADMSGPKKSWFKRPAIIIPIAIVVLLIVVGVIVAAVNGTDHSKELANAIKNDGQPQLQSAFSDQLPGSTVTVNDVKCVEKSNSQEYTCLIHMAVTYQGETKNFIQNAEGTCDKKLNTHCLWHTTDLPQQTASQ